MRVKKNNIKIALAMLIIFIVLININSYIQEKNDTRIKISKLISIEVFKLNDIKKFNNDDKILTIVDKNSLSTFKSFFNNLDRKENIEKVKNISKLDKNNFEYFINVALNFEYVKNDKKETGKFLLAIFIDDKENHSYINFVGTDTSYKLEPNYTKELKEIFDKVSFVNEKNIDSSKYI